MSPERYATLEAMSRAGNTLSPGELARMLGIKEEAAFMRMRRLERMYLATQITRGTRINNQYTLTNQGLNVLDWCRRVWLPERQMQGVAT